MMSNTKKAELLDDIVTIVHDYFEPQEIYSDVILGEWAEANGYKKNED